MTTAATFRTLAIELKIEETENALAAVTRGWTTVEPRDLLTAENRALRLMLDAATFEDGALPLSDGTDDLPLSLLARTFGSAWQLSGGSAGYLASLAALVSAASGSFSSARVLASLASRNAAGALERWAMGALASRTLSLRNEYVPAAFNEYVEAESHALADGTTTSFNSADRAFERAAVAAYDLFPASESPILLLWAQVRARFRELSAARILRDRHYIPHDYLTALLDSTSPLLFPSQVAAIEKQDAIAPGPNALVLLPTSTGKSLIGELSLVAALTDAQPVGVYLAPYRALADQLYRRMKPRLAQAGIDCELRRGGYLQERALSTSNRLILVATPEAFDAVYRLSPGLAPTIACCVFDEFHLINQPVRGICYEGLVGRMLNIAESSGKKTRIVALSPLIAPSLELTSWLRAGPGQVVQCGWRPTARRLAIARPDAQINYFTPGDHIGTKHGTSAPAWTGSFAFPFPIHSAPTQPYGPASRTHDERVLSNVAAIAVDQHRRFQLPVLVVASTRAHTRKLATLIAKATDALPSQHPLLTLADRLTARCPHLVSLPACLRRGVAYHNAGLPDWVRMELESLMEQGHVSIVVATTTLAEGVDLPFRVVLIADWRTWRSGRKDAMPTLLFRNIAGRCGRAGVYAEGDTVIVDNPGRGGDQSTVNSRYAEYIRRYIMVSAATLETSVDERIGEGDDETQAALESQYMAYVAAVTPAEGREESDFVDSTFAAKFAASRRLVEGITARCTADMLAETEFPVLVRGSPLELTALGEAVLRAGLSPRTAVAVAKLFRDTPLPPEPIRGRLVRRRHDIQWASEIVLLVRAALDGTVPLAEVRGGAHRRIGKRGYPVTTHNLELVLLAWISGVPVVDIAYLTWRQADTKEQVEDWLRGVASSAPAEFEDWVENVSWFLNSHVAQQWSWLLRGAGNVLEATSQPQASAVDRLAKRTARGVRHLQSAELMDVGCAVDRHKVDHVVDVYIRESGDTLVRGEFLGNWLIARRPALVATPFGLFSNIHVDDDELGQILDSCR